MQQHNCTDVIDAPHQFVTNTWQRFEETGTVEERARTGRPCRVAPEVARLCGEYLCKGYELDGVRMYYVDVQDACERCEAVQQLVSIAGVTHAQMWEAVKREDPGIMMKVQEFKFSLPPAVKEQRLKRARDLDSVTDAMLDSTTFLDELTLVARPQKKRKVIARRGEPILPQTDARLNRTHAGGPRLKEVKVNALYAVNAVMGLVGWWPLSGTTDWPASYKVRHLTPAIPPHFVNSPANSLDCHKTCTSHSELGSWPAYALENSLNVPIALLHLSMAMLKTTCPFFTSSSWILRRW
jgi:hypothetical protein